MQSIPRAATDAVSREQLPPPGALNVDHVSHFVPDMDAAGAALERLGFTLTPFSRQSHRVEHGGPVVPAGTANRCIMLERGYLEFLTPTADTPLAGQLRTAMARYIGIHVIAFGTSDAARDHARAKEQGFAPLTPVALERPISTETGEGVARFTVVRVPPEAMPEGRIQFCEHRTPELLWQLRWVAHPNRVSGLASVFLCVTDASEAAWRYGRYMGLVPEPFIGGWRLQTARGTVMFFDRPSLARVFGVDAPTVPWIAGYALQSADPVTTRQFLETARCDVSELADGRIVAHLPPAVGGVLVVEPAESA